MSSAPVKLWDGTAWVLVTGVAGPAGPQGPEGPQGAPGPAGEMVYPDAGLALSTGTGWGPARSLMAGSGISITHGDGLSGDPLITNTAPMSYPAAGVALSTGAAWAAALAVASEAQLRAGSANALVPAEAIYGANAPVLSSGSGSFAPNFAAGRVFQRTLTGASTLANPSNQTPGQSGLIYILQDATGGRSLAYGTAWRFIGGAPGLAAAGGSVNVFSYYVRAAGAITVSYLGVEA